MRPYDYVAYTPAGRRRRGTVLADSEAHASDLLRQRGLLPAELVARPQAAQRLGRRGARGRLNHDILAVFTRQMAVLLTAGLSAEAALEAVEASGGGTRVTTMAALAGAALRDGRPLSQALASAEANLPPYYAAAIRAGEYSGETGLVFDTLANYLETVAGDRAQLAAALVYPAFVAGVSVLVCGVLLVNVAPEIVAIFEASGHPLPPLTQAMLALRDGVQAYWWALVAGAVLVAAGLSIVARVPRLRDLRDRALLRLPLVGRFIRMAAAAQYLRTLALVVASRQPVIEALRCAADVLTIAAFRAEAEAAGAALHRGETLSAALAQVSFLPPVARQLVQAGEVSARLAQMTERAAVLAETWLRTERTRLTAVLDPLLMILVGGMVLVIVLAILLPIFDMQTVVSGG